MTIPDLLEICFVLFIIMMCIGAIIGVTLGCAWGIHTMMINW